MKCVPPQADISAARRAFFPTFPSLNVMLAVYEPAAWSRTEPGRAICPRSQSVSGRAECRDASRWPGQDIPIGRYNERCQRGAVKTITSAVPDNRNLIPAANFSAGFSNCRGNATDAGPWHGVAWYGFGPRAGLVSGLLLPCRREHADLDGRHPVCIELNLTHSGSGLGPQPHRLRWNSAPYRIGAINLVELTVVSARADQLVMSCRILGKVQAVSRLSPCH
jgi:hypothetical protein